MVGPRVRTHVGAARRILWLPIELSVCMIRIARRLRCTAPAAGGILLPVHVVHAAHVGRRLAHATRSTILITNGVDIHHGGLVSVSGIPTMSIGLIREAPTVARIRRIARTGSTS